MKTMGLVDLRLVNPREDPTGESRARARGGLDILENAGIHRSIEEAIAGCHTVIGTSARMRGLQFNVQDPHEMANDIAGNASMSPVAILFGREAHGLFNEELQLCHSLVYIPANPDYSSLNLGSAVQIIAYELRMAFLKHEPLPVEPGDLRDLPATSEHMDDLFSNMRQLATRVEFLKPTASDKLFERLRRLYLRAHPSLREVNILRGIMRATNEKLDGVSVSTSHELDD